MSWPTVIRVYFASQLGKYVPGKAWVLVIRVALCRHRGISHRVLAVTAAYETLTNMAAGALLAVCLLPWFGPTVGIELVSNKGFALIGIAGLPVAMVAVSRIVGRRKENDAFSTPSMLLLARGFAQSFLGWIFLAIGLRLTLLAAELPVSQATAMSDLAAITLSYVAGFVVLVSPGGLGAREFVLQQILTPRFTPDVGDGAAADAVVIALVLRLTWTAFEVVVALASWMWERRISRAKLPQPFGLG